MTTTELSLLVDRAETARAISRASRASAARERACAETRRFAVVATRRVLIPIATRTGQVCALDGDGTTLCTGNPVGEKIIGYDWSDVPAQTRCGLCSFLLDV